MHRIWPIWPQFAPLQSPAPRPRNCKSPPTVGCVESSQEDEYRLLVDGSVLRCGENYLHLSMMKMKETVVHFGRSRSSPSPGHHQWGWGGNCPELQDRGCVQEDLSCLYFHMRSFVKRTIFYAVVWCAVLCSAIKLKDASSQNKLIRNAGSVEEVVEQRRTRRN